MTRHTGHLWTCAASAPGNRWLPRIDLAADLEGGGSVVFLEFAAPVDHAVAGQVAEQWRTAAGDAEFQEVRRAAQLIDAGYRESTPWWGKCDLNEAHIRRAADGRLVLIEGYYTVTPQGQLTQTTAASLPTTATGSYNPGLSTTQQSQLIAQAINQAATVGKILALQPGQSLLANGTVVGTGVSASSLLSSSSSSSILLLGAGLLVLMLVLGSEK